MRTGLRCGTLRPGTALVRLATTSDDHRAAPPLLVGGASDLSPRERPVTDRKREPEPMAMPPRKLAALHAARKIWVSLAWDGGSGHFQVGARLVSLQGAGPSVTCSIRPRTGPDAEIVLDLSDLRALTFSATVRVLRRGFFLSRSKPVGQRRGVLRLPLEFATTKAWAWYRGNDEWVNRADAGGKGVLAA
jgi:hypothetical protein